MKILLLMPPTDLTKSYGGLKGFSNPQPSIGIAYIAAILRENGFDVKVIDAYVEGYALREILDIVKQYEPDVIGISVLTPSAEVVYEISKNIRFEFPNIKIIMGNMHASLFSDEILSADYADYIVHREGELTMLNLLRGIKNNDSLKDIRGVSFKKDSVIVNNPPMPYTDDLDALPFPAWDLFPMDRYSADPRTELKEALAPLQILATRGCPNQCTFCSSRTERGLGTKYRMRGPQSVINEMVYMNERYGAKAFSFVDLAFPLVRRHAVEFCNGMIDRGLSERFKWATECRVKPLDEELLARLREAGCERICLGIESGDDDILCSLKKDFTVEDVERAVTMAHGAGLEVDGMFMIGLPAETEETVRRTVNFAIKLNLRYAIFNIFIPYPGCELWDALRAEGKVVFKNWSDFTSYPSYSGGRPVYVPDAITHERLMYLQRYAMRKFYIRPKFIYDEFKRFKSSQIGRYYSGLKGVLFS